MKGASPALTWYGGSGLDQRIELSGKVCANHVAKIANYLSFECGLETDGALVLDVRASWKAVLWASAGLMLGARVSFLPSQRNGVPDTQLPSDLNETEEVNEVSCDGAVLLTDRPGFWITSEGGDAAEGVDQVFDQYIEIVALNLEHLAFGWNGDLPDGVLDGQAEVLGQADALLVQVQMAESNWADFLRIADDEVPSDDLVRNFAVDRNGCGARKIGEIAEKQSNHNREASPLSGAVDSSVAVLAFDTAAKRVAFRACDASELFSGVFGAWAGNCAALALTDDGSFASVLEAEGF